MGENRISKAVDQEQLRAFMKSLLADVQALETMLDQGMLEADKRRIGAEQEMFLVDAHGRPACKAGPILQRLKGHNYTTELAQFNLEANLSPQVYGGDCLRRMENELISMVNRAKEAAAAENCQVVMLGILPSLRKSDLSIANMTQNERYLQLNEVMTGLRGGRFNLALKGVDELETTHDNVMLEACNTSFQVHFQVSPGEFARLYNLAQLITAPVLATAVNSPLLLGQRLWKETRVALFQQSVDSRSDSHQARGGRPRVSFGDDWVKDSVLEIFKEDVARFRTIIAADTGEDALDVLAKGGVPTLPALRLHNGTVYRWNRPCYGISDGKPHLRIENRVLPAGPSLIDEMATSAFFFGLMSGMGEEVEDIARRMSFDDARGNFVAAARHGLKAELSWLDGEELSVAELILDRLLPLAHAGLEKANIDEADRSRYLGVLEERVKVKRTGAKWVLRSLAAMGNQGTKDERMRTLTSATMARQQTGEPVHLWELASLAESGGWRQSYMRVNQYMTTDLFTVSPEDIVDLAASLMDWRHIRHVPVEDHEGRLVGLVSHRSLLRLLGKGLGNPESKNVAVKDIMKKEVISVGPETTTLEVIELMRNEKVSCLPVVENEKLVGIITEHDLITVSSLLFEQHLKESSPE